MWLKAKKRVEYNKVPKIMINDWVNKEHTKLNMFSVYGEQIRSLCSKPSKLNFWNQLHPQIVLLCCLSTKTATWPPNHIICTKSVEAILKAMTDTVSLGSSLEGSEFILYSGRFFQQERVLWGWLAGPSHTFSDTWSSGDYNIAMKNHLGPPLPLFNTLVHPFCSLFALFTYYTKHIEDVTFLESWRSG